MRHFAIILFLIPTFIFAKLGMTGYSAIPKSFLVDKPRSLLNDTLPQNFDTTSNNVTIDNLKIGSKYLIDVESSGCFHYTKLNLTISRYNNGYFATFSMRGKIEGQKINRKFSKSKLNESQLDTLRIFEKRITDVSKQDLSCTTVDLYNLNDGKNNRAYKDNTCNWQGIGKLVKVLFNK